MLREIFTPNEQALLIEALLTRIDKVSKIIPTLLSPELKISYENDLIELKGLHDKLNNLYYTLKN
jgi:hypothetical protein